VDKTVKKRPDDWFVRWDKTTSRALGARILGPQAEPAVGQLSRLMNDPRGRRSALSAASILHDMGNAGLPPLLAAFTNQQATEGVRRILIFSMGTSGTNARAAVPLLLQLLKDSDPRVRADTTNALQKIDPDALEKMREERK